ncbi:MAG: DEAD/DEAH box helicase family protein [Lachnospiraceae bacterium]|nr:DEAD/DEAH box helicase family protein [Lachnospiraceae bacterium]
MARSFSKNDAVRLAEEHENLLMNLQHVAYSLDDRRAQVKSSADALILNEVNAILSGIPVEELNRDGAGIRIKNLRDSGINTIADVQAAGTFRLEEVDGISESGARKIKSISREYAEKVKSGIRIKLSADTRDEQSTALVGSIYRYKSADAHSKEAGALVYENAGRIKSDIADLEPSRGTFKWLFSSSQVKQKAESAYSDLDMLMRGEYGIRAGGLLENVRQLDSDDGSLAWADFKKDPISYFTILEDVYPGILESEEEVYGLPEDLSKEVAEEKWYQEGLHCKLRRYQEWGVKYALHQKRVLLGDEMGLGKTVQAIATMVSLKNTGATHFAVVCPASVLSNWCREIKKHSSLEVVKVHGKDREDALALWIEQGGVAVTTYETTAHFKLDPEFKFTMLVVDEAHYIKNPAAARTKNVRELSTHSERMLFMTGTALENKVDEMVSLMEILQPEVASGVKNMTFMSNAPQFREKVAPVYYRRKRDQVLTELPELIENMEWCEMTPQEEAAYVKTLYSGNLMAVRRVSWNVEDLKYSSKANRLKEIVEEARDDDRKVIVFSFFLDTLKAVCEVLGDVCTEPINGSVPPSRRQEIIDEFDNAPAGTVLPAQIQSGGTGLNIQSASVVVICEPQYKPSTENQAISRAYRMGQARNVLVYRLMSDETVDERILEILERKQKEFDAFADKSVAGEASIELSEKEVGDIIGAELERINEGKNAGELSEMAVSPT